MEKLFRTQYVSFPKERMEIPVEEPLELDNKAFNIVDGDKKMLDYLNYSGTIAKGSLAADGVIKLCPNSFDKYKGDYGAVANPIKRPDNPILQELEPDEEFDNEWDNIFLKKPDEDNFFMEKPDISYA